MNFFTLLKPQFFSFIMIIIMSFYPISAISERPCSEFYLSGADIHPDSGCEFYPCLHTESHDLDWLADTEDLVKRPLFNSLIWVLHRHPEELEGIKRKLTAVEYTELLSAVSRCQRLDNKKDKIRADFWVHERMMEDEQRRYYEYWNSLTEEQLEMFRQDPAFYEKERLYAQRKEALRFHELQK